MTVQDDAAAAFSADWAQWHRQHEAALADPHGHLAITGLHWLHAGPERFAGAPGAWSSGPAGVVVVLADGEEISLDGVIVRGEHHFGVIPERGAIRAAFGDAVIEVAKHGGYDILRPRHPGSPLRTGFRGVPAFPPDPRWVVPGRYVAFDEPRPVTVGAVVEGLQHVYGRAVHRRDIGRYYLSG